MKRQTILMLSIMLFAVTWSGSVIAEPTEAQIKAAFIYRFAQFTTWPEQQFPADASKFVLCVASNDEFYSDMRIVEGKSLLNGVLTLKRIQSLQSTDECHSLFIQNVAANAINQSITLLVKRPLLTVSDIPGFAKQGGMIELVNADRHIRFDINQSAAERVGISFSAQLLKLARVVYSDE